MSSTGDLRLSVRRSKALDGGYSRFVTFRHSRIRLGNPRGRLVPSPIRFCQFFGDVLGDGLALGVVLVAGDVLGFALVPPSGLADGVRLPTSPPLPAPEPLSEPPDAVLPPVPVPPLFAVPEPPFVPEPEFVPPLPVPEFVPAEGFGLIVGDVLTLPLIEQPASIPHSVTQVKSSAIFFIATNPFVVHSGSSPDASLSRGYE